MRELDITKLLRAVRDIRLLKQSMMSPGDSMLMRFQKQRIIQTEESDDAADKFNFRELLEDPQPGIRLAAITKLQRSIKELDGHHVNKTRKSLIDGIFQTKQFFTETNNTSLKERFTEACRTMAYTRD
jgi:hypothetical protein